ncbi:hypothetical protein [Sphingomicrobium sediminis]|uniref:Uncharacterized protein n=1 Tax=Sphingomicrobium sediminis TaxID=2950949 RepID=A0A9X2J294_9SPHN|nr:hypothetical protein [Sphingomicrobium sediminis]MCM8556795.1 hypothetical protein [Sphingomicrobium sediminis]
MSDDLNRRTETARRNDDSDLIDNSLDTPNFQGRFQGDIQTDVATQASQERVRDAEATEGVTKEDDINHGQRVPADQPNL